MVNKILVVKNSETAQIEKSSPAKLPIGDVVAYQGTDQHQDSSASNASIGVWESSPGVFRRHLKNREFSHIIAGHCIFTPDEGDPVELRAGDAVLFPENCEGVWDIKEDFRKTYILF